MSNPGLLDEIIWKDVPKEACRLAKEAAGPYQVVQDLMPSLPAIGAHVWYNPDKERAFISYPLDVDSEKQASWYIALRQVPGISEIEQAYIIKPPDTEPYIHIKQAIDNESIFKPLASLAQYEPNALNKLWGGPNPLAATIGGGLLGAGLGYGGGWLAEQVLPDDKFEPGVLRRNTAMLGGLMGAAPGIWHGFDQQTRGPNPGWGAWLQKFPWHDETQNRFGEIKQGLARELPKLATELNEQWQKAASEAGGDYAPVIPVDQFGRTIWNDLRSQGGYTPPDLAAATTGIVQAASMSQGNATLISPADIARIGIGMGSGYASGLLVGKTLGALAGLRPETQQTLQQAGVWVGILANTVPLVFKT
jgi:hypothetical protein